MELIVPKKKLLDLPKIFYIEKMDIFDGPFCDKKIEKIEIVCFWNL